MSEFPLSTRMFLKAYRWRRIDPVPWAVPRRPLSECRLALASSAGLVMPGQEPFDDSVRGGDSSFREIPADAEVATMIECHRSDAFDHSGLREDPNLGFPLDRLREMQGRGEIGELNRRHLSFMGSITAPGRMVKTTAPEAVGWLVEDAVDVVLLVPV